MSEYPQQVSPEKIRFAAERQAEAIEVTPRDFNSKGELFATPGGGPSELPEHLWKLVRTDAFREWFGEWQHAPVGRFYTSKDSVYMYDEEGHTYRFKAVDEEQYARQDITVFADLDKREAQAVVAAYRAENSNSRVCILEKQDDGSVKEIQAREDVTNPDYLILAILYDEPKNGSTGHAVKRVSLQPAEGLIVFDMRHFEKDGKWMSERHLGHEVVRIHYAPSDTSELLKNGEPLLVRDPRSADESDFCFIRSVNPLAMDRKAYAEWAAQFGEGADKRSRIMSTLRQRGYDGLMIDGELAPVYTDEQMMRVRNEVS